jgi:hypothetical protein
MTRPALKTPIGGTKCFTSPAAVFGRGGGRNRLGPNRDQELSALQDVVRRDNGVSKAGTADVSNG